VTIRRIATLATLLLLFCAAGGFGRRAVASLAIVNAQQNSTQAAAPEQAPQQSSAPAATPPLSTQASQQQAQRIEAGQAPTQAIKAETREVRVDVVVTNKKGDYITDLTQKDFKVYEDNKEQPINTFSFGADPTGPAQNQRHYLVLFFDNSSMDLSDQPRARAAAGKFIDAHAGPDQVMSVMNFGGTLQVVQNFTTDADRLKKAVSGIANSNIATTANASNGTDSLQYPGMGNFNAAESSFGTYTLLLSLRSLAKNLAAVPGRKSLILFTAGFELDPEGMSELTATIDACNKANVAVYPLDVRGLAAPMTLLRERVAPNARPDSEVDAPTYQTSSRSSSSAFAGANSNYDSRGQGASMQLASFHPDAGMLTATFQHGGGGGGHGGGGTGGGTGGTGGTGGKGGTGGTGGTGGKGGTGGTGGGGSRTGLPINPNNQPRSLIPPFPASASTNQQVMYDLANGTGGFPILNTNDLLPGLEKISREQNSYYLLGYAPEDSKEGSCHTLKVKVERGGANVRARSGFCNVPPTDPLAGKPIEKDLESRAAATGAPAATKGGTSTGAALAGASSTSANASPTVSAGTMQAPYFYSAPNEAQVHVALEVPASTVDFQKIKGKYHADVNILGIAYKPDGTAASRFSDELTFDLEKPEWEAFQKTPMHYENQFAIVPGTYRLSVALGGGGDKFGTYQTQLAVDPFDGKRLSVSSVFLSSQLQPTSDDGGVIEAALLADRTPFVVHKMQLTPSGGNHFKKSEKFALYAQIYAPQLIEPNPPTVRMSFAVVDPKTGKAVTGATKLDTASFIQKGSAMIPIALKIPLADVPPGEYTLQFQASTDAGALSQIRSLSFVVE
jgi:VWFA-related protein